MLHYQIVWPMVVYEKYEKLCQNRVANSSIDKVVTWYPPDFGDRDFYRLDRTNGPWTYASPAIPQRKGTTEA